MPLVFTKLVKVVEIVHKDVRDAYFQALDSIVLFVLKDTFGQQTTHVRNAILTAQNVRLFLYAHLAQMVFGSILRFVLHVQ